MAKPKKGLPKRRGRPEPLDSSWEGRVVSKTKTLDLRAEENETADEYLERLERVATNKPAEKAALIAAKMLGELWKDGLVNENPYKLEDTKGNTAELMVIKPLVKLARAPEQSINDAIDSGTAKAGIGLSGVKAKSIRRMVGKMLLEQMIKQTKNVENSLAQYLGNDDIKLSDETQDKLIEHLSELKYIRKSGHER